MRIGLVVPAPEPPVFGGAQRLWRGLVRAMGEQGDHSVELVEIPTLESNLMEVVDSYRRFSELDMTAFDMVISTKYPAWMVSHPRHVVYMQHKLRGLYDTYPAFLPNVWDYDLPGLSEFWNFLRLNDSRESLNGFFERFEKARETWGDEHPVFSFPGPLARKVVHYLDDVALQRGSIEKFLAISHTVALRQGYFPKGVDVTVVAHPSDLETVPPSGQSHMLSVGRLDGPKRVAMLIDAMQWVGSGIPLKIVGTGPESESLRALASGNPWIHFLGDVDDAELASLYSEALAVPFVPLDEDLGLITFEAMSSGKPVVTCFDSGGPNEWVRDGLDGLVTIAEPRRVGRAITWLAANPEKAAEMGQAGMRRAQGVTWQKTASALLAEPQAIRRPRKRPRKKVCVLSTYPIHDPKAGGAIRSMHVYGALRQDLDVEVISLSKSPGSVEQFEINEGFSETVVPKSKEAIARELEASFHANVPLDDVLASRLSWLTSEFEPRIIRSCRDASVIILSHPYLYESAKRVAPDLPLVYDAHNFELDLKRESLPEDPLGASLLEMVRADEAGAIKDAAFVSVTSSADGESMVSTYGADPAKIVLIPNGVDTSTVLFSDSPARGRRRQEWLERLCPGSPERIALFIGSWHGPNLEAAARLLSIAPDLPDVMFLLAGDHSAAFSDKTIPSNVRLLGKVTNLVKMGLLGLADAGLNPMSQGAGTNLKMLEYFSAGIPVASTAFGSRGFEGKLEELVERAEIGDFAGAIRRAIYDDAAQERTRRARTFVEEHYDWAMIGERFRTAVLDALG